MCCNSSSQTSHSGNCGCQSKSCFAPALWSKKRQIQYVKNSIACLQSQVKDLEDKLDELENAK
jgi:hypothetical protein